MNKRYTFLLGFIVFLASCSPVESYEDYSDPRRGRTGDRGDREKEGVPNGDFNFDYKEDNVDEAGDSGSFMTPDNNSSSMAASVSSNGKKIDFLFIIDGSSASYPFLRKDHIDSQFSSFISNLREHDIDWRFYFLSAEAVDSKKSSALQNGRPFYLERDGVFIRVDFLSQENLEPYNLKDDVHSVFLDTLSYNATLAKKKTDCGLPPYCGRKYSRPLLSLKKFISGYKNLLRSDAALIPIIISARDEGVLRKKELTDPTEVMGLVREQLPSKEFFSISIVVKVGERGECGDTKLKPASLIPQLSLLSKGTVINICSKQHDGYGKPIIDFLRKRQGIK